MSLVKRKRESTKADIDRFAGKWVAMIGSRVVASADTLPHLADKIRHKWSPRKPSVMLIPRKDEGPYILMMTL
jgi:hypothetical protein